jgi:DNA-directed RNA polymerase
LAVAEDVRTAEMLSQHDRFWTPVSCDWRGRVYPMSHFNFQRDDRVRALFLFADGAPIGTEGLYWLKVHLANCGDFEKISKRPLEERVAWVDQNMEMIQATATVPLQERKWTEADKPFLFLAVCMELIRCPQRRAGICHEPSCFLRWKLQWPPASLCNDAGAGRLRSKFDTSGCATGRLPDSR